MPCFADDSGLVVDALGGAPGIYSARYASMDGFGEDHNFSSNIDRLLHEMRGVSDRRARFVCVVALIMPRQESSLLRYDTQPLRAKCSAGSSPAEEQSSRSGEPAPADVQIFEGKCEGRIAFERAGCGGFGYDPVFIPDACPDRTLAEVDEDAKNAISHRGDALAKMLEYLNTSVKESSDR